jgi:hypothetical protein
MKKLAFPMPMTLSEEDGETIGFRSVLVVREVSSSAVPFRLVETGDLIADVFRDR